MNKVLWWLGLPIRATIFLLLAAAMCIVGLFVPDSAEETIREIWQKLAMGKLPNTVENQPEGL